MRGMTDEQPMSDEDRARREAQGKKIGLSLVLGLFVGLPLLGGAITWATQGWDSDNSSPDFGEGEARVMCEDFVKDRLRSPSTADFQRPDIRSVGEAQFEVSGTVDAQNAFGATVRQSYVCKVEGADGVATLLDLQTD